MQSNKTLNLMAILLYPIMANKIFYLLSFMEIGYEIPSYFYPRSRIKRLSSYTKEAQPTLSITDHRELALGLLRGLIRWVGLTVEELLKKK